MCSQAKAHADKRRFGLALSYQNGLVITFVLMWVCNGREWVVGTWECFTQKRSPKCGILSSKLRSPVCKGRRRRRRWGCGSVRAVSVWPAHVTCLLLRAMAVAKEQVTKATVVAMEAGRHGGGSGCQLVYEVVWWGTFTGITGRCTESTVVSSASHKGNGPRGLFFKYARV